MSQVHKLALTYASLFLGGIDALVGLVAVRTDTLHQMSPLKIGGAIALQAIFIAAVWAALELTSGLFAELAHVPLVKRFAALAIAIPFVLLTIVSTSLLYNGVACGEYPFVLHKNRSLCNFVSP